MIELICHIILIVILGIAFYQDWKFRAINWVVFPTLLTVSIALLVLAGKPLSVIVFNVVFIAVVIGCLFIYVSIKRGGLTNIFKADLGLGDVLFLIAITPLFIDRNFILFFIGGMLFSGITHFILHPKNNPTKIPLAGYLALFIIALRGIDFFIINDLFYTPIL